MLRKMKCNIALVFLVLAPLAYCQPVLIAGGVSGFTDGAGSVAQFDSPYSMESFQNLLFVGDHGNNAIRRVDPTTGDVTTVTTGFDPYDITFDSAGNLYAADWGQCKILKVAADTKAVSTLAGSTCGNADGSGTNAQFSKPTGIVYDKTRDVLFVTESSRIVRKVTLTGDVTFVAGSGSDGTSDGFGTSASFGDSYYLAALFGYLLVPDYTHHTIRAINPDGLVVTLAGAADTPGTTDGAASAARFNQPSCVTIDEANDIYVGEWTGSVRKIVISTGEVTTIATGFGYVSDIGFIGSDLFVLDNKVNSLFKLAAVATSAPTSAPTEQPTDAPTAEPTDAPTEQPTDAPTEQQIDASQGIDATNIININFARMLEGVQLAAPQSGRKFTNLEGVKTELKIDAQWVGFPVHVKFNFHAEDVTVSYLVHGDPNRNGKTFSFPYRQVIVGSNIISASWIEADGVFLQTIFNFKTHKVVVTFDDNGVTSTGKFGFVQKY